ncbi:MAG: sulfite oxidase [Chloroflexi bacterium]|nr:sulfite oxidase [Chloroflexota bacterium]
MARQQAKARFRPVGDGSKHTSEDTFLREEMQLAFRNRGIPLEALRYPLTPTGMHFLLTHFDVPEVMEESWLLNVGGLVSNPLTLTLAEIKSRPSRTVPVTLECAGNGRALLQPRYISQPWLTEAVSTSEWTGTPLKGILDEAGVSDKAVDILFTGLDQGVQSDIVHYYQRSLNLAEATRDEVLLAYAMNGEDLQPQHGYPLRLIVPGWYGMTSVKWLDSIEAIPRHFDGYQMDQTYRYTVSADRPGEPVTTIRVRSLMVPPGIPEFLTRTRLVKAGQITVSGRAWAGRQSVSRVEFSDDDGMSWRDAELGEQVGEFAWIAWSYRWDAKAGRRFLRVRATDSDGNVQPSAQPWTLLGMGNNMTQRVEVIVSKPAPC